MKTIRFPIVKFVVSLGAAITGCFFLVYLLDVWFDGVMATFLYNNFVGVNYYYTETGEMYTTEYIVLSRVYWALLILLLILVCGILFTLFLVSYRQRKKQETATILEAGKLIRYLTQHPDTAVDQLPMQYAEITAQMVSLNASMERQKRLLQEEAQRKSDLITYLAHDLKTPLTSVIGYLSLLEEVPQLPEEQKEKYTKIALDKALRLERLINEFFDITRYNLHEMVLETQTFDLCYLLRQLVEEFYPLMQQKGCFIQLQIPESLPIQGDPDKLARVFQNLLKNAASYSYPNSPILLTAMEQGDSIRLTVENQGKTIPPYRLESIFEKFFRLDESRSTDSGEAGLGLAIAREIVTLHNGSIEATSQQEHTVFTVILPKKQG